MLLAFIVLKHQHGFRPCEKSSAPAIANGPVSQKFCCCSMFNTRKVRNMKLHVLRNEHIYPNSSCVYPVSYKLMVTSSLLPVLDTVIQCEWWTWWISRDSIPLGMDLERYPCKSKHDCQPDVCCIDSAFKKDIVLHFWFYPSNQPVPSKIDLGI